jgi:hypothetical protein
MSSTGARRRELVDNIKGLDERMSLLKINI